jgi:hypothetical protein
MVINKTKTDSERSNNLISWLILAIILLLVVVIRIRILEIPLERDEGEYAYCGQLLLQMILPFKEVYTMKLPGTCLAYSLIMLLFGQTIKGIHLGLLLVNCLSIILLFLITRKLLNYRAALITALVYAVLSVSPTVLGFAAHATHFIVLFALAGTYLLLICLENGRPVLYLASGLFFGLAFLMKQQGIFFVLFGGYAILHAGLVSRPVSKKKIAARFLIFAAGCITPLLLVMAIALLSGAFDKFWFWTFRYSAIYASTIPLNLGLESFYKNSMEAINGFAILWITAAIGFLILITDRRFRDLRGIIISFSVLSFLAVSAGLYFRKHYFIMLLPAVAILMGICIDSLQRYLSQKGSSRLLISLPLLILLLGIVLGINTHQGYFLYDPPETLVKDAYDPDHPFPEALKMAEFLKSRTTPEDKIAVLGSEPEILFYAQRRSATGYIYTYELMRNHDYSLPMQQEMIGEIEQASPKFLIFFAIFNSWLIHPDSKMLIFNWFHDYAKKYYRLVGRVELVPGGESRYLWGDAARSSELESPSAILIYERRQGSAEGEYNN